MHIFMERRENISNTHQVILVILTLMELYVKILKNYVLAGLYFGSLCLTANIAKISYHQIYVFNNI